MKKNRILPRLAALALALAFGAAAAMPAAAAYDMPITLSAEDESVYLVNLDTGDVLLDQNSTTQRYVASLTKMITGLLLVESGADLSTTITIPERLTQEFKEIQTFNGADMGLKIGENVRLIDLLYGLLLPSANDAASVIADYLGNGDTSAFVDQMNARAAQLGCTATTFTCPHGLYDQGNFSTAQDLAKIAAACRANEQFMAVATTLSYTLPATNVHTAEREIVNTNPLQDPSSPYYREGVAGIKTGFTTLAGKCYVAGASKDGHNYLLVILGAKKEDKDAASYVYTEADALLDWTFARFSDRTLLDASAPVATLALRGCDEADSVPLYAAESVTQYAYEDAVVTTETNLPDAPLKAPLKAGETIGTVSVYLDGALIQTVDLVTAQAYDSALLKGSLNALALVPVLLVVLMLLSVFTVTAGHRRGGAHRRRTPENP
jgi:D-alanyl-D-alanine carboxypeptidase (penicillin-binding protein 5/6)